MKRIIILFCLVLGAGAVIAADAPPRVERILSAAEQAALTPEQVVVIMQEGNQRFLSGDVTSRDHSAMVRDAVSNQFPKAVVLSCLDSRVPVEDVFDRGIGDIFVARVAGNFANTDILGSMEYGTRVAGAKLILVLGHTDCGAIKSAIGGVEMGNITALLANIKPAIDAVAEYEGEKTSANDEYVRMVTEANVKLTVDLIRERSPIISEMEKAGELRIAGALYDMHSGAIALID